MFGVPETTGQIGRVTLPPTPAGAPTRTFAVRPHELDPMAHVNNAVYLDWLEEAVVAAAAPDAATGIDALPRRYRLEYALGRRRRHEPRGRRLARRGRHWCYRLTAVGGPDVFRATLDPGDPDRPGGGR